MHVLLCGVLCTVLLVVACLCSGHKTLFVCTVPFQTKKRKYMMRKWNVCFHRSYLTWSFSSYQYFGSLSLGNWTLHHLCWSTPIIRTALFFFFSLTISLCYPFTLTFPSRFFFLLLINRNVFIVRSHFDECSYWQLGMAIWNRSISMISIWRKPIGFVLLFFNLNYFMYTYREKFNFTTILIALIF